MKIALSLAALTGLFCGSVLQAAPLQAPDQGTIRVTVLDSKGAVVPDAPIYIYGEHRTHFVGGADIPGSTTFSMKEGTYRISSALVQKAGDNIDRFSSNEAHVTVVAGDNVSIVLTLKALESPEEQRAQSYATLHIAAVPGNLYLSN